MDGNFIEVTCPTCFEVFSVPEVPLFEAPCSVDYDCEVCCQPMRVIVSSDEAYAIGMDD